MELVFKEWGILKALSVYAPSYLSERLCMFLPQQLFFCFLFSFRNPCTVHNEKTPWSGLQLAEGVTEHSVCVFLTLATILSDTQFSTQS